MTEKIKNIRPLMKADCSFLDVLGDHNSRACCPSMMGYTTSRFLSVWRTSFDSICKKLFKPRRWQEMLDVSKALTINFPTPASLLSFCQYRGEQVNPSHFNLYIDDGDLESNYWISVQATPDNFEVKVHSIVKGES